MVLLSGCVCSEVSPWVSQLVASGGGGRHQPEGARNQRRGDTIAGPCTLAGPLGELARLYRREPAKPVGYRYPTFLNVAGAVDLGACADAADAGRTSRADALWGRGTSRSGCSAGGQLPFHGSR